MGSASTELILCLNFKELNSAHFSEISIHCNIQS